MSYLSRKAFLQKSALFATASVLLTDPLFAALSKATAPNVTEGFSLPPLPYTFNALEPYIDARTMEIHYTKYHQAYVNNLNKALIGTDRFSWNLDKLVKASPSLGATVRNNAGGHWNHSFFWRVLTPNADLHKPSPEVLHLINKDFGSIDQLKEQFIKAAMSVFGSGWAWLVIKDSQLSIGTTANQDNPLMEGIALQGNPVLGVDVWEHAYYLKYQNMRADYVKAFWELINWRYVHSLMDSLKNA